MLAHWGGGHAAVQFKLSAGIDRNLPAHSECCSFVSALGPTRRASKHVARRSTFPLDDQRDDAIGAGKKAQIADHPPWSPSAT
jgi:hypothetical protein